MNFVLVHGASHGGWCWKWLAPELRKAGHEVYVTTQTGLGERRHLASPEISLETHVMDIANVITYEDLRDVVLVGHSNGGVIISKVAEAVPDRLKKLIYLAALVLVDGETVREVSSKQPWTTQHRVTDEKAGTVGVDPKVSASIQCHDGTPEQIAWVAERITPHPLRPRTEKVDLKKFYALSIPKEYIICKDDHALPREVTETFARRLGVLPHYIDGGHDVMVTHPKELAQLLHRLA